MDGEVKSLSEDQRGREDQRDRNVDQRKIREGWDLVGVWETEV
jgi:hypothetical protein